jgi:hypothetical protein
LDLYARKLVGWAMSETMPQELTLSALDFALGGAILMQAWCTTRTEVPRADSTDRRNTFNRGGVCGPTCGLDEEVDGARGDAIPWCSIA